MVISCANYWNISLASHPGDLQKDEKGKETFKKLGENMAYTLKKLNS